MVDLDFVVYNLKTMLLRGEGYQINGGWNPRVHMSFPQTSTPQAAGWPLDGVHIHHLWGDCAISSETNHGPFLANSQSSQSHI